MLKIEGKTFMNIQEAVQWLLDNNALPFQSTANYAGNTEIGLGTIVNPTPAKVRIGSLIFFADSKVSTVVGITETGFICSDKYNNLVDDIAYVTGVSINASGHLITTLSDGQTIDAGIVKQVSSFSIDGSQHLIANFNDGTSQDLGAIFNGNVVISGYFEQGAVNWESNNLSLDTVWLNGLVANNSYMKITKINKVLYVVVSTTLENNTNSPITTVSGRPLFQIGLPSDIASKIYRKDGTPCNQAPIDSGGAISAMKMLLTGSSSGITIDEKTGLLYSAVATGFAFWISNVAFTIPANTKYNLDARTFILL